MNPRFVLRIESGRRKGEEVPLSAESVTIGRRSSHGCTIRESSVSSDHAELTIRGDRVELRDLGSTNGTRVRGETIDAATQVFAGDSIAVGQVRLRLVDLDASEGEIVLEEFGDSEASPAPGRDSSRSQAPPAAGGEFTDGGADAGTGPLGRGDAVVAAANSESIAQAKARPRWWLVGLAAALAVAAALWWGMGEQSPRRRAVRAAAVIPGNLYERGSFESLDAAWAVDSEETASFSSDPLWRATGERGLGAYLAPNERAEGLSEVVRVRPRRSLELQGRLRVEGGVVARLGVRLEHASRTVPPIVAWSRRIAASDGFVPVALDLDVPPSFEKASLWLQAEETAGDEGSVALDDVGLTQASGESGLYVALDEHRLYLLGSPALRAALLHVDRPVFTGLRFTRADGGDLELTAEGLASGFEVTPRAGAETLTVEVDPDLVAQGLVTLGESGYRTHPADFERAAATDLLLGEGLSLVRLAFPAPVAVRARVAGRTVRFDLSVKDGDSVRVQLRFLEERTAAERAAVAARESESRGAMGEALQGWSRLLEQHPFDAALVQEAEASVGRLLALGLDEVAAIRKTHEQSQFFGLAGLYRREKSDAREVADRFAGTEVATAALELHGEIAARLEALEGDRRLAEEHRLEEIHDALEREEARRLAERVAQRLEGLEGEGR